MAFGIILKDAASCSDSTRSFNLEFARALNTIMRCKQTIARPVSLISRGLQAIKNGSIKLGRLRNSTGISAFNSNK